MRNGSQSGRTRQAPSAATVASASRERRQPQHQRAEDAGSHHERAQRDREHVVQIDEEEQRVAAEQRAEQRAERVPGVEPARDAPQPAHLAPQMVEDQRQQRAGEPDRDQQDGEHAEEHEEVIRIEARRDVREEDPHDVGVVGRVLQLEVQQRQQAHEQPL